MWLKHAIPSVAGSAAPNASIRAIDPVIEVTGASGGGPADRYGSHYTITSVTADVNGRRRRPCRRRRFSARFLMSAATTWPVVAVASTPRVSKT